MRDNELECQAMNISFVDKVKAYDKYGLAKSEIDRALVLLKDFRAKFPFAENPESIESLKLDDIFKRNPDALGEFSKYLEVYLKPLGHLTIHGSIVYQNIRAQIDDFKDLLYLVVDKKKTLAQKVDANWEKISRLGLDKHIAKKIIFCFNYESGEVLPIFSTKHLWHFFNIAVERSFPANYSTLGEEYEYLTEEILNVKNSLEITQQWQVPYFARFLYDAFPPPDKDPPAPVIVGIPRARKEITREQSDLGVFVKLLVELQDKRKINGEQFREYRDLWMRQPNEREALTQRLQKLLGT